MVIKVIHLTTMRAEEKAKEQERRTGETKPKMMVARGLLLEGVNVAPGDGFGSRRFLTMLIPWLEQVVKSGVALQKQPTRVAGRELSRHCIPLIKFRRLMKNYLTKRTCPPVCISQRVYIPTCVYPQSNLKVGFNTASLIICEGDGQ